MAKKPIFSIDPQATAPVITEYLKRLQSEEGPYVHENPISFLNDRRKGDWFSDIPDAKGRDTYSRLWAKKKGSKRTWIALFSTHTKNYVGNRDWDTFPWHAWAVAVISPARGKGKHVLIYDCDPRPTESEDPKYERKRPHQFLISAQKDLVKLFKGTDRVLWYNADTTLSNQNKCLLYTCNWIEKMVEFGDHPFMEDEKGNPLDPRVEGFVRITRK